MGDHYRASKVAIWLNLVPDLVSAAKATEKFGSSGNKKSKQDRKKMLDYKLYSELLPYVPKLKTFGKQACFAHANTFTQPDCSRVSPMHFRVVVV